MSIDQNVNGLIDLPDPNYKYITRTEDALRILPKLEK